MQNNTKGGFAKDYSLLSMCGGACSGWGLICALAKSTIGKVCYITTPQVHALKTAVFTCCLFAAFRAYNMQVYLRYGSA